jgi:hypothetical protein
MQYKGYTIISNVITISEANIFGNIISNLIKFGYFNGYILLIIDPGT